MNLRKSLSTSKQLDLHLPNTTPNRYVGRDSVKVNIQVLETLINNTPLSRLSITNKIKLRMAIIGTVIYFGFLTSYVNAYPITLKFIILVTIFDMFKIDIIQARI